MLSCALNLANGRDTTALDAVAARAGTALLDVHRDRHHDRSVLTLGGDVVQAAFEVARAATELLDLSDNDGVHPRLGIVDVVPFSPLGAAGFADDSDLYEAIAARGEFARRAGRELGLPCFIYGPERTLPDVRRAAFSGLFPATGPAAPSASVGACCVGARPCLVAYNLYLERPDIARARELARSLRSPSVRALGLRVGTAVQVSMNLVAPWRIGPADVYDAVAATDPVLRAELVGLVPEALLAATDQARWAELDLGPERTIEARLRG